MNHFRSCCRACFNVLQFVQHPKSHRQFTISAATRLDTKRVPLAYNEIDLKYVKIDAELCPVLMTHGLLGSKQNWNAIAKVISKQTDRRVILFDARNHGDSPHTLDTSYESMAEDILGLVETLGIKQKFVILGHSMGGRTVSTLALKYPEKLAGVVVVDISPLNVGADLKEMKLFIETMKSITFDSSTTLAEARKIADVKLKTICPDPVVRMFLLMNLGCRPDESGNVCWKPNLDVLGENLHEIVRFPQYLLEMSSSVPALFLRGGKSAYVPDKDLPGIKKLFPKAEFATIPKAGHWPQAEYAVDVVGILVNFLKKTG